MSDPRPFGDATPIVYSYSRRQALEDGVLFDLSIPAGELGFDHPVACTANVYHRYLTPDPKLKVAGQSIQGRTHDLLWTLFYILQAAKRALTLTDHTTFKAMFLMPANKHATITFVAICGPGDTGEPVITILLPGES